MKKMERRMYMLMGILAQNPRESLVYISRQTNIPVSTIFDTLQEIAKEYTFKGQFVKR